MEAKEVAQKLSKVWIDTDRAVSQSVSQSVVRTIGVLAPAQVIFQEEDSRQLVKLVDIYLC